MPGEFLDDVSGLTPQQVAFLTPRIQAGIRAAVEAEREACAKTAEECHVLHYGCAQETSRRIRARGTNA
jgi:hypothetical protein